MKDEDETRRALDALALGVAEGVLTRHEIGDDLRQLTQGRGDLTAYFNRSVETWRE